LLGSVSVSTHADVHHDSPGEHLQLIAEQSKYSCA
jgi:hypothetical protein